MNPMNVFVFPTRNEPGLELIHSLAKSNKICLFGGSSYESQYDPGRCLLKNYVLCPGYKDDGFAENFQRILRDNGIDLVFPAWDRLVALFSDWQIPGIRFVTPRSEIAHLLLSKKSTYDALSGYVPTPKVYSAENAPRPVFAKPDGESGSRGIMEVWTDGQFALAVEQGLLLCENLPGMEYTVDCLSDLNGRLLFSNVRMRGRVLRGIAAGTCQVEHPDIVRHIRVIAETLRIEGPWFAQFKENADGEVVLLEINARVAGSMTLTRFCGVNIPLLAAFMYGGYSIRIPRLRRGVVLNRYLSSVGEHEPFDWVIWDWDDTLLRKDGKPDPQAVACLYDLHNRGVRQLLLSRKSDVDVLRRERQIPDFFEEIVGAEDKLAELDRLLKRHCIDCRRCVMVNDAYSEIFAINERYPEIRIVTPDGLDLLARERVY